MNKINHRKGISFSTKYALLLLNHQNFTQRTEKCEFIQIQTTTKRFSQNNISFSSKPSRNGSSVLKIHTNKHSIKLIIVFDDAMQPVSHTRQPHTTANPYACCSDIVYVPDLIFFSIAFCDDTHSPFAIKIVYFYLSFGWIGWRESLEILYSFQNQLMVVYGLSKMRKN